MNALFINCLFEDPEVHDYEQDYEGAGSHEQHYSDREIVYDGEQHRGEHSLHEIDSSEGVYRHDYKTTDYTAAYGLEGHYDDEEFALTATSSRDHVAPLKKGDV